MTMAFTPPLKKCLDFTKVIAPCFVVKPQMQMSADAQR